jgi:hypothetical protein
MPGSFGGVGESGGAGVDVEMGVSEEIGTGGGLGRLHDNSKRTNKTRNSFLFMFVKRFYIGQSSCLFVEKYFPPFWRNLSLRETSS